MKNCVIGKRSTIAPLPNEAPLRHCQMKYHYLIAKRNNCLIATLANEASLHHCQTKHYCTFAKRKTGDKCRPYYWCFVEATMPNGKQLLDLPRTTLLGYENAAQLRGKKSCILEVVST